ncbi:gamma-butyrobetaine hydroxylase-like domain-containing protein [Cellvibrio japonicus]|uniref:Gamma-butyrobetaine hydroxylase-like N-terminal domain-containing protein n=1 Tax=Cellvibrio japonicus (strain Ueda107) TaxID=498211 RepID=B3PI63_CELJU|nr:DUF971 domain-containing protein [Cellvibrio japonicus]ACE85291.1 conserved hypothetical protein [Cellvibrio japonicus Ueda107]QEI11111.1 DUF971 domain-containing protein [Cellvibrio japonicus]QEI14685.1 DUF971 domain-containing protein [Cellvibrio japonicus]QEI18265.1 DUF971 domain-containing protein [Cellvibrio japonicus]
MTPTKIQLHKQSRQLELHFGPEQFVLSAEFLRVHSPSAEVKGHGPGQAVLQYGKRDVGIQRIERAGNYALKLVFDDGHETGIYTWDYLYQLGKQQASLWESYLTELHNAGKTRQANTSVVRLIDPAQ